MVDVGMWLAQKLGGAGETEEGPPPFPEVEELKEFNEETMDLLLGELKGRITTVDQASVGIESKTLTLLGFVSGVLLLLARFAPDVASSSDLGACVRQAATVFLGACELSLGLALFFLFSVLRPRESSWPKLSGLVDKSTLAVESRLVKPSILWSLVHALSRARSVNSAKAFLFRCAIMITVGSVVFLLTAGLLLILT